MDHEHASEQRNHQPSCGEEMLIVVGGLPGTGKSTVIGAIQEALGVPVYAKDVLEASLWGCGINHAHRSGWVSYELLTTLAREQLRRSQSAILDSVATTEALREGWRSLATEYGTSFRAVECVCSDELVHRSRIEGRERGIPGWPELTWADVEEVRSRYEPWTTERLVLDATRSLSANIDIVLSYLAA